VTRTGVVLGFVGCDVCLRRLRRRFFPVGPVVLSKVTASTRTGGVIGTLSRSAADSLGGMACVGHGTLAWDLLVVVVKDQRWPRCFTKWNACSRAWLVVAITYGV
jgi:hypothetical protein